MVKISLRTIFSKSLYIYFYLHKREFREKQEKPTYIRRKTIYINNSNIHSNWMEIYKIWHTYRETIILESFLELSRIPSKWNEIWKNDIYSDFAIFPKIKIDWKYRHNYCQVFIQDYNERYYDFQNFQIFQDFSKTTNCYRTDLQSGRTRQSGTEQMR